MRGDRAKPVAKQLSWKTSEASAGGVPQEGIDCDDHCVPHLSTGVINLTDGAAHYEPFAGGEVAYSPSCDNPDCLKRARLLGKDRCVGWRPRSGRERFRQLYRHGVVSQKQKWCVVKKVAVHDEREKKRMIQLKHGPECADGAWAELKASFPNSLHSSDHERIASYIHSWAWRALRRGSDLFATMGTRSH